MAIAQPPTDPAPRSTKSLRFARVVVRQRGPVALLLIAISLFFAYPILNTAATATLMSLAYMSVRNIDLNVNTLPVQAVGIGIGVDYAIYIVDRIRQEAVHAADVDQAIRRAIRTTGMAVTFTATTIVGGIVLWMFSTLRFQAEMAQLLVVLMLINMLGAITIIPAFYSIYRPRVATSLRRAV